MSQELHYTSVPRGLKAGTRGFCTVAVTPQMPGPLVERLENLSGYQPVYPPHDPAAARNPVNFAHVRFNLAGRPVSILSRVGPAVLDYTGRANKYAHHVVIDAAERPEGGPAWLLSQPGFMQASWDGEPRMLVEGRPVPHGDRPGGIATAWAFLTGDAGWAGTLAESFLTDPKRPAFVVFRPGMDLLPLITEAIALLPPSRRWDVEFSTYLTQAPRGMTYAWRGVIEGSPEASSARRLPSALVIDLCGAPARAEGGALVHTARTGERREWSEPPVAGPPPAVPARRPAAPAGRPAQAAGGPPRGASVSPPGNYELIPELAARLGPGIGLAHDGASLSQARPRRTGVLIAGLVATGLALLTTGIFFHAHVTKQFGLTPEVQEKLSDSHEAIRSQKQEKAALERPEQKAGPLIAIQPRVGAPEPKKEPVLAPKPTEDQLPPKPGNVSPPSALPEIAAKRPTTIKPLFCVLEEPPEAFAADARPQDIRLDDKNLEIKSMELIGADARHVAAGIGAADVPELVVLPKSSSTDSLIGGPPQHKLATFRASKRGVIEFTWCDGDSQERQRLRDCVLVVKAKNDEVKYLVLRSEPSSPKDSSEFQAHLDSQSSPKYMYTIYNWDDNGNYYNLYKNILITSCYLHTYEGKAKFDFKADGEGTWTIADEYGQPLLSVELSRVERQRDATTGGQKLVLHAPSGDVPIRRAARNKEPRRADKWLAVVIKLFDPDPLGLPRRIQEKEAEIAREKKDEGKSERRDKMREIEKQIKRLVKLNEIFRSLLNLKIVWNVEGVKLEIAHMDARKLVQDAGP